MTKRALIQNGRITQIFSDDFELPDGLEVVDAPDDVKEGDGLRDGKIVKPNKYGALPGEYAANENNINAQLAKQELVISDRVLIHFYELALPVDAAWKTYRETLRSMVRLENDTTTAPIPLPPRPAVPWSGQLLPSG